MKFFSNRWSSTPIGRSFLGYAEYIHRFLWSQKLSDAARRARCRTPPPSPRLPRHLEMTLECLDARIGGRACRKDRCPGHSYHSFSAGATRSENRGLPFLSLREGMLHPGQPGLDSKG